MRKQLLLMLLTAALPLGVMADDTAPAPSGNPQDSLSPMTCKKPPFASSVRKADDDSEFQTRFQAYQDCIKDYAAAQNKLAQMHTDAANAAITEFNAYTKEYNERQEDSGK